jgi:hypothetical protein
MVPSDPNAPLKTDVEQFKFVYAHPPAPPPRPRKDPPLLPPPHKKSHVSVLNIQAKPPSEEKELFAGEVTETPIEQSALHIEPPKMVHLSATAIDQLIQRQRQPTVTMESETTRPFVPPFFQQMKAEAVSGVRKVFDMAVSQDLDQDVRELDSKHSAENSEKLDFTAA